MQGCKHVEKRSRGSSAPESQQDYEPTPVDGIGPGPAPAPEPDLGPEIRQGGASRLKEPVPAPGVAQHKSGIKGLRERVVGFVKPRSSKADSSPELKTGAPDNSAAEPQEPSKPSIENSPVEKPSIEKPASGRPQRGDKVAMLDRLRGRRESKASPTNMDAQPVKLSSPPEIYEFDTGRTAVRETGSMRGHGTGSSGAGREEFVTQPRSRDTSRRNVRAENQDPLSVPGWRGDSRWQPPAHAGERDSGAPAVDQTIDMTPQGNGSYSDQAPPDPFRSAPSGQSGVRSEPIRLPTPPVLERLPSNGLDARQQNPRNLAIPRIALCQEVRSFEDYTELDAQSLVAGQPVLLYATLANYQSDQTPQGYRTLTTSALEVRSPSGDLVARQPLGTATDMARSPRRDFFLTHQVRVPASLVAGDYVFQLTVYDLIGKQVGQSQIAVRVMEDQSLPGEMADTSGSATGPGYSPR